MKYQKGTFITVPNIQKLQELPPAAQALFMWLCSYADNDGVCFPSRKKLAHNLHCSVRTIDAHLKILQELGFIEKTNRINNNEKQSNLYQLLIIGSENIAGGSAKSALGSAKNDTTPGAKSAHRTKSIITKPTELNTSEHSSQQISEVIFLFIELNKAAKGWYANKTQRAATNRLIEEYGFEKVCRVVQLLRIVNTKPFFPTITTPYQLEQKWSQLEAAFIRYKQDSSGAIATI